MPSKAVLGETINNNQHVIKVCLPSPVDRGWVSLASLSFPATKVVQKWPDKSTTGYDRLDFKLYKKFVLHISANQTSNIAKVCI